MLSILFGGMAIHKCWVNSIVNHNLIVFIFMGYINNIA